jgi:hypothetical protein
MGAVLLNGICTKKTFDKLDEPLSVGRKKETKKQRSKEIKQAGRC